MQYVSKHIVGLPYQSINKLFLLMLEHGTVHLSDKTIQHIRERHPKDYDLCMAFIDTIIAAPDFIGQSPLHSENFVLIKKVEERFLLTAISTIPDEYNEYPLQSAYMIDHNVVQRRLRKGFFKRI
jgi:hypothetical protein